MRIAVNTRLLVPGKIEGLGRFACESLKRITKAHPEHEFIFIFDRRYSDEFLFSENIIPGIAYPQARHPLLWYLFFEWGIPYVLKKYKADIFLSPDGWVSLRSQIPSLAVIHDLNFFHDPSWVGRLPRAYYNYFFPRFINKADRIATVSQFSKTDIVARFKVAPSKIDVVYNGAEEKFHPIDEKLKQQTRLKLSGGAPYFLFLGLIHPRKNLTRIIRAFEWYRNSSAEKVKLVVAGSTKYWTEDTRQAYEKSPYRSDILLKGRLPEEELNNTIASSRALVYASLFEGFGIPILEAMRCEVPVITSNTTSMPEVGGDAVCYIDPYSELAIGEAMLNISRDKEYSEELIKRGRLQCQKFSWDQTAERLWKSIERIM
jgi:glycosyltransferase involved in cell wall biosynthesis